MWISMCVASSSTLRVEIGNFVWGEVSSPEPRKVQGASKNTTNLDPSLKE